MANTNGIALLIEGTATIRGSIEPLVTVGVVPRECEAVAVGALLKEPLSYVLRHTATHRCYTVIDRSVRPYGSLRKGTLSISIAISRQRQLANRQSPYTILKEIYNTFVALNMWAAPTGEHIFNEGEYDRSVFVTLLGKYRLESAQEGDYVEMPATGKKALVCIDTEEKLSMLMRDSQYPELRGVSQLEIGRQCAPTINIPIPRPATAATPSTDTKQAAATGSKAADIEKASAEDILCIVVSLQQRFSHKAATKSAAGLQAQKPKPECEQKPVPKPERVQKPKKKQITIEVVSKAPDEHDYYAAITVNGKTVAQSPLRFSRVVGSSFYTASIKMDSDMAKGTVYAIIRRQDPDSKTMDVASQPLFLMGSKVQIGLDKLNFTSQKANRKRAWIFLVVLFLLIAAGIIHFLTIYRSY